VRLCETDPFIISLIRMKTLKIGVMLLYLLAGCTTAQNRAYSLPDKYLVLNESANSDSWQMALAAIVYLSDEWTKGDAHVRFIPFTAAEVQQIQKRFNHKVLPAAGAKYLKSHRAIDPVSKEEGVAIGVLSVSSLKPGDRQGVVILEALYHGYPCGFRCQLANVDEHWRVQDIRQIYSSDVLR